MENYLEFSQITKRFAGVEALSQVSFSIRQGEIHCLCGENGAGKSTLINLCAGVYKPDGGSIKCKGNEIHFASPVEAEKLGIGVVFQEVPLCKNMSIACNMFLGPKPLNSKGLINRQAMNRETKKMLEMFDIKRHPDELVGNLTIAEQSLIQIARVLRKNPECIILDEPTSTLTPNQKDVLFQNIRRICSERTLTVIYVSHRMEEIFELTDRITVLKDGKYVKTLETKSTSPKQIVSLMVGRDIDTHCKEPHDIGSEIALEVQNICRKGVLHDVSFSVKKGEILGFSGLQGAGRSELARVIFGLDKKDSGKIFIDGKHVQIRSAKHAIENRIGLISENRRDEGIIAGMSVKKNIIMVMLKELSTFTWLRNRDVDKTVDEYVQKLKIKIASPEQKISGLSGGNQQKVIIARWLAKDPKILICDEPTRGIDVGAKAEVHATLFELAKRGIAVIVISSDLPEVLAVSDRIIVMRQGKITGELDACEACEQSVMQLAAGVKGACS